MVKDEDWATVRLCKDDVEVDVGVRARLKKHALMIDRANVLLKLVPWHEVYPDTTLHRRRHNGVDATVVFCPLCDEELPVAPSTVKRFPDSVSPVEPLV
jgi:hypothetical protein